MEPTIYPDVEGIEVHSFGDYVSVCWNLRYRNKKVKDKETGNSYTIEEPIRGKKPYIDFIWVRTDGEEYYEDDDSTVEGGFGLQQAEKIILELQEAIVYMKRISSEDTEP